MGRTTKAGGPKMPERRKAPGRTYPRNEREGLAVAAHPAHMRRPEMGRKKQMVMLRCLAQHGASDGAGLSGILRRSRC